jgi:L,D-transpeptidase YcbB
MRGIETSKTLVGQVTKSMRLVIAALLLMGASSLAMATGVPPSNTKTPTISEVLVGKKIAPMITAESADKLAAIAVRYRNVIANGGFPKVPSGSLKKGSKGKSVVALNRRLFLDGYLRREATEGEFAEIFTTATEVALKRFQVNMGYIPTGKIDGPTLKSLNTPAEARLRTIEVNIERLRIYGENLGDRYLVVNVPSQQIETVSNGKVYSRHNAIVGRPDRPTPVVVTALSDINFNPYWNAPISIVERDILPKLRSSNSVFTEMNMKVFQGFGGPEVDPDTVDWQTANLEDYHFRQEPGEHSAMATGKINFPSPFGIYLHDTPERQLFKTGQRFYSSGCVRVEKVDVLMEWVLNGQDGIDRSQIAALAETLERRDVKLTTPPQLRVTYLTAWPVGETVAFHHDIYELDGTGFIVGQPLPVGETSDEGLRYVLKPVPRKAGTVDAFEADGFDLFKGRKRNAGEGVVIDGTRKKRKSLFGSSLYEEDADASIGSGEGQTPVALPAKKTANKRIVATKAADDQPKLKSKKKFEGLFDWESYRKKQKLGEKKVTSPKKKTLKAADNPDSGKLPKSTKKQVAGATDKKTADKIAANDPAAKKVIAKKKIAATSTDKKPIVDTAKKLEKPLDKKLVDNCKVAAGAALPKTCTTLKKAKAKIPAVAVN